LASIGPAAAADDVAGAAAAGEVVVLATPWAATEQALRQASSNLADKILIDCTNPLKPDLSGVLVGLNDSGGEQVARWAPRAMVFKTLNQTGFENMTGPSFQGGKPAMFVCGNDDRSKPVVIDLISQLGFEVIDAGVLSVCRMLEPYALLWIHMAHVRKLGTHFAFGILRR
jgi:predicted dinucleotide-binding enzyme